MEKAAFNDICKIVAVSHTTELGKRLTKAVWQDILDTQPSVNIQDLVEAAAYSGFDHNIILDACEKKWTNKTTGPTRVVTIAGIEVSEGMQVDDALRILATVFLIRGSNAEKIKKKSKEDLKVVLEWLTAVFSIKKREGNQILDNTQITLPRIAACMPVWCVSLIHKMPENQKLIIPARPYMWMTLDVPRVMQHPIYQAICPTDETVDKSAFKLLVMLAKYVDGVINKNKSANKAIQGYVNAAHSSPIVKSAERLKLAAQYGLVTVGTNGMGTWKDPVKTLIDQANAWYDDEAWE